MNLLDCLAMGAPRACSAALFRNLTLAALLGAVMFPAAVIGAEPESVESVETITTEWVKARMETSRLETEWSTQRQLLESTVGGLVERAQTLETKRDYLQAKTAKDREELTTLQVMDKTSVAGLQAAEERVKKMSARLIGLRHLLPPRLSMALEMSYRSLAASELAMGERMQLNMTILGRCAQFNRAITCEEEVLDVNGKGNTQLLEVVYWGLSHGYALDRTAGLAWLGSPDAQGWHWESRPEAVPAISKLISIYHDKADPDFVTVPARLNNTGAEKLARSSP